MADQINKLGRYELGRVLGTGAMGVVYEAFDPKLTRKVAIKTIIKSRLEGESARSYSARFNREAAALAQLNHPNIVQVYDFGEENDVAYIVMEFVEDGDLRDRINETEKFAVKDVVQIISELLEALDFAHKKGVIHRDIKPANVMFDIQGRVKLADFGVARIENADATLGEKTQVGTQVGTPLYMSPEQVRMEKLDRRSDIFSAGVILYQLLTGERPFYGDTVWSIQKKIVSDDPNPPSSIRMEISIEYDQVINKALAKDRELRYDNGRQFKEALQRALTICPPPDEDATVMNVPPPAPSRIENLPTNPLKGRTATTTQSQELELEFWRAIKDSDDPEDYDSYTEQFPQGTYSSLALRKAARLRRATRTDDSASRSSPTGGLNSRSGEVALREAEEGARRAAEQARREAQEKTAREREERERLEAEEEIRSERAEQARKEAVERARLAAEAKIREEAKQQALKKSEERARFAAQEKAREEAEQAAQKEAEERARLAAQEKAREEAELAARIEAEERARLAAQAKAREEAQEQARRDVEERERREAEARAQREAEARALVEAEKRAREEAAALARKEAEERARRQAEEEARRQADARALQEAERARREAEARQRKEAEAKKQAEDAARLRAKREEAERARRDAKAGQGVAAAMPAAAEAGRVETDAEYSPAPPRKGGQRVGVAVGAAILVIAAGGVAYMMRTPAPDTPTASLPAGKGSAESASPPVMVQKPSAAPPVETRESGSEERRDTADKAKRDAEIARLESEKKQTAAAKAKADAERKQAEQMNKAEAERSAAAARAREEAERTAATAKAREEAERVAAAAKAKEAAAAAAAVAAAAKGKEEAAAAAAAVAAATKGKEEAAAAAAALKAKDAARGEALFQEANALIKAGKMEDGKEKLAQAQNAGHERARLQLAQIIIEEFKRKMLVDQERARQNR